MNWQAHVLSSASSDTEPTIVIMFESAKYVFNVGENTTRAIAQSGRTWRKIRSAFLSRVCTETCSGLPGFLMTLADSGAKHMTLVGPEGLVHNLASMRLYTYRDTMAVTPIEIPAGTTSAGSPKSSGESVDNHPIYKDENLAVFAVPVLPSVETPSSTETTGARLKRQRSRTLEEGRAAKRGPASILDVDSQILEAFNESATPSLPASHSSDSLEQRFRSPSFSPVDLAASEADEWRQLTVEYMFGSAGRRAIQDVTAGKVWQPALSRKARASYNPAGCDQRLPVWTPSRTDKNQEAQRLDDRVASSFIIRAHQPRGKFDAQKAKSLGLGPGPLRGKVTKGETVEIKIKTADGQEITRRIGPQDCLCAADKAAALFIIDCPTPKYIDNLIMSPNWEKYKYQAGRENDCSLHVIFHLVGDDVLEDERYGKWMNSFGQSVHHLVSNRKYCPDTVTFTSAAYSQLKLHQLDTKMFPLPYYNVEPTLSLQSLPNLPKNVQSLRPKHHIEMRPLKAPAIRNAEGLDMFHPAAQSPVPLLLPHRTAEKFDEAREAVRTQQQEATDIEDDVVITPLGTSSSKPTKYRNVTSNFIHIPSHGNIILDCGEGTWGQLARHFGTDVSSKDNVFEMLRNLRCIFISHIHGDHHIGLSKILAMRQKLHPMPAEPLFLVADSAVLLYLKEYSDLEDLGFGSKSGAVKPILSEVLHYKRPIIVKNPRYQDKRMEHSHDETASILQSHIAAQELREVLGLESFQTVDVSHRTRCFGVVIKHINGWSLVYSGDTMPSNQLVEAGADATLLIHEATMGDEEEEQAKIKAHSTFGQAVEIGRRMNAQNTLLTHFSARYPRMAPPRNDPAAKDDPILALALDNVRVPLHSFWKLQQYHPAIEQCFSDLTDEEHDGEVTEVHQVL